MRAAAPTPTMSACPLLPSPTPRAVLSPAVTRQLLDQVGRRLPAAVSRGDEGLAQLTEREREVLRMLAAGLSNAEIAEALVVSEATVKSHVSNLLNKLDLRDRVQAVIYA
jgi:DNA-binding NarL/FixJ family response regulator